MKLSTKSEYGLLALIELGLFYNKGLLKTDIIAKKRNIPKKYLEQILTTLKTSGYIIAKRGAGGGISLTKSPSDITLAEIIRLLDGALAPVPSVSEYFYSSTPVESSAELLSLLKEIRNYVATKLENTSLKDILPE